MELGTRGNLFLCKIHCLATLGTAVPCSPILTGTYTEGGMEEGKEGGREEGREGGRKGGKERGGQLKNQIAMSPKQDNCKSL